MYSINTQQDDFIQKDPLCFDGYQYKYLKTQDVCPKRRKSFSYCIT